MQALASCRESAQQGRASTERDPHGFLAVAGDLGDRLWTAWSHSWSELPDIDEKRGHRRQTRCNKSRLRTADVTVSFLLVMRRSSVRFRQAAPPKPQVRRHCPRPWVVSFQRSGCASLYRCVGRSSGFTPYPSSLRAETTGAVAADHRCCLLGISRHRSAARQRRRQ